MATIKFKAYVHFKDDEEVTIKFFKGKEHTGIATIPRNSLGNFGNLEIEFEKPQTIEGNAEGVFTILRMDSNMDVNLKKTTTFKEFFETGGRDSTGQTTTKPHLELNTLNKK